MIFENYKLASYVSYSKFSFNYLIYKFFKLLTTVSYLLNPIELYLVQPSPAQFTIEPQDLVFFPGSDISLHCETNCIQLGSTNVSCSIGFLYNGCSLEFIYPFNSTRSSHRVTGQRTLTIHNANSTAVGQYQCFTYSARFGRFPLTDRIIGRPIHLQIAGIKLLHNSLMI